MVKMIFWILFIYQIIVTNSMTYSQNFIPADNPNIQYYGRWDFSDAVHPRYSWPGVYIFAEFTGTTIGIRLNDKTNYFNVYIDGKLFKVFHGDKVGETDYVLADNLNNSKHTFLLSRRNITFDEPYTFAGIILNMNDRLLPPVYKPLHKIEFIGDSYTAAESNEATEQELAWELRFPVTNFDMGFAHIIADHFKAQYIATCRSGSGIVCDWQGNTDVSIPNLYDRTLMTENEPKWDFSKWIPDVIVICLGFNDYSGLKDKDGNVSDENSLKFRNTYHDFLKRLNMLYPKVKIVAVAAHMEWIQKNVKEIVEEEKLSGSNNIYYSQFDYFPGGYVANGHATVETHKKIADQIIKSMDSVNFFEPENK